MGASERKSRVLALDFDSNEAPISEQSVDMGALAYSKGNTSDKNITGFWHFGNKKAAHGSRGLERKW
jgi:hypothetical protein